MRKASVQSKTSCPAVFWPPGFPHTGIVLDSGFCRNDGKKSMIKSAYHEKMTYVIIKET